MFAPGDRVGVAVSGGPDSVCLLHLLMELRSHWDLRLTVLHLDHQLRGEASRADAEFVAKLAASFGLPFVLERANPAAANDNLEQAARNARRAFFHRLTGSGHLTKVATGHTLSDQAETVLLRLLRGSGSAGLAGILPVTREGLVRPLLRVDRGQVESWLSARGISWQNDETNLSRDFLRNRIRLDLLPLLRDSYNPRLDRNLAQLADVLREEDELLRNLAGSLAESASRRGPSLILTTAALTSPHRALARRLVRQAISEVRGDLRQIEFEHVEAILKMAESQEGHARLIAPGVDVMRSFDWIRFAPPGLDSVTSRVQIAGLNIPGDTALPGGRIRVRTRITNGCGYNVGEEQPAHWDRLDWETLDPHLQLRYWLPGDHYQPIGSSGPEKLKQMFQARRIPLWDRRFWPIIESSQGIVWSRQFGPSARNQATPATKTVLEIAELENSPNLRNQIPAGLRL